MAHTKALEREARVESHKYVATAVQAWTPICMSVATAIKAQARLCMCVVAAMKACARLRSRVAAAAVKAWVRPRVHVDSAAVKAWTLICKTFATAVEPWSHVLVLAVYVTCSHPSF